MAQLSESQFNEQVDATLLAIEEAIDESGADIDYENVSGILTLIFEDGSQVIINRQGPVQQLWLAAKRGGYHFDYDGAGGGWVLDSDGTPLFKILNDVVSEQAGEAIYLD